jgi:hypothetical protein
MMMQQGKGWISIGAVYGDGGDFVEVNDRRIYTVNGRVHELLNGALSSRYMSPPSRKFYFQSPFIKHPNTEDSLHFLVNHVWRYDGKKWKNLSAGLNKGGYKANSFAIAQSNANTMYLSFDQPTWNPNKLKDKLYKSVDGGETWVDITSSLPTLAWKHVTSITINPNNEQEVYISLGMMDRPNDIHKAYKSVDGGKTWENISQGLTHHETFKIQFIHGSKSGIILSAADGVYYRNDQFVYWLKLKGRISNTAVRDFEIDYQEKVLIAGTYGHGPWRMKITKRLLKN